MDRPASIKIAAIFLLAASILWIGNFAFVTNILIDRRGLMPTLENPRFIRLLLSWGLYAAIAGWASITSVGLLRLRAWARVSILSLSATAAYHFLGVAFAAPFLINQGQVSGVWTFLMGMTLVFLGLGGLAGLAIFEFTSQRMDRVFQFTRSALPPTGETDVSSPVLATSKSWYSSDVPLSLLVIGVWLVLNGPLALYEHLAHFNMIMVPLPLLPLGMSLDARSATAYVALMAVVSVALGFGLLRWKVWACRGAIGFCIFSIISQVAAVGTVARAIREIPNVSSSHPQLAVWSSTLWSIVPPAMALFFLLARRNSPPRPPIGIDLGDRAAG